MVLVVTEMAQAETVAAMVLVVTVAAMATVMLQAPILIGPTFRLLWSTHPTTIEITLQFTMIRTMENLMLNL